MRWKMPNVAIVAVATAAVLFLVTADTVLDGAGGGSGGSNRFGGGGGGGGGGGERQRGAATAAANRHRDNTDSDDEATQQTPATVQCGASCTNHEEIKTLSIELIKASILNKLGMRQPPEFGDRLPLKVPTDLPPLQDLMRKYNNERSGSVVVLPHMRHQSHHNDATGDGGGYDMQSDEASATGYAATMTASNSKNGRDDDGGGGGGDGAGNENDDVDDDDDDEDDYHVRTHKLIAFAQPHPTIQKLRGHSLLFFTFSEQTGQHKITQAILWVYRKRLDVVIDDSVVVIEVNRINQITMHQTLLTTIKHVINTTEPGWVPINLQKHMFKTTDRAKNLTLMVHSYYHTKNASHAKTPYVTDTRKNDMTKIPYLEVHTQQNRRSRARRHAVTGLTCNETSEEPRCCRYPLMIDFDEFGWDWIIYPKTYSANYCYGACEPLLFQRHPHTHLVQMTKAGMGPCCTPRKMSTMYIMYYDANQNIIYGRIPGMVAEKCGCS